MVKEEESKRGGWRPGAGRPPAENPRTPYQIRLTQDERNKLARLGGVDWIRERIRLAKEPQA